jgi:putative hemolysin
MILFLSLLLIIFFIFCSGFFSGSESGLYFLRKEKLSVLSSQGNIRAKILYNIIDSPAEMICIILIGNNLVMQLATYSTMWTVEHYAWMTELVSSDITTTVMLFVPFFLFGEVLPKITFRLYAEPLLLFIAPILDLMRKIMKPITFLFLSFSRYLENRFGDVKDDKKIVFDRSHLSINFGHAFAGGVLSKNQIASLVQAINVDAVSVERIMTPIRKSVAVSTDSNIFKLSELFKITNKYVFPVYKEKKSNIIGVVDIRKVLQNKDKNKTNVSDFVEPPVKIPKGSAFNSLFEVFFTSEESIAFIHYNERIIGYINREDAILKLLR